MPLFDGKAVFVTGSGSGFGQAACHLCSHEGPEKLLNRYLAELKRGLFCHQSILLMEVT